MLKDSPQGGMLIIPYVFCCDFVMIVINGHFVFNTVKQCV